MRGNKVDESQNGANDGDEAGRGHNAERVKDVSDGKAGGTAGKLTEGPGFLTSGAAIPPRGVAGLR